MTFYDVHKKMMRKIRGPGRIRTAVNGFADQCLATRPRNQLRRKIRIIFGITIIKVKKYG